MSQGEHSAGMGGGAALALCAVLFVASAFFAVAPAYGPGFDEYLGDQVYGERSLAFLGTGDGRWLDLYDEPPALLARPGRPELAARAEQLEAPHVHGHLAAIVAAASCRVLTDGLGWLPAIEAYHAANLVFLLPLLVALLLVVRGTLGTGAAWLTLLFLAAQPRLVGHVLGNTKDVPQVGLFGLSLLAAWHAWSRGSTRWLLVSAALWGSALSVKINAVFLPVILAVWWWLFARGVAPVEQRSGAAAAGRRGAWKLWLRLAGTALLAYVASWPLLWRHPQAWWRHVQFIIGQGHTGTTRFDLSNLRDWLAATPELVLAGVLLGAWFGFRERDGRRRALLGLCAIWLAIPLARANLPGFRHYDGIRHVLEITVPTAVLCAHGWLTVAARVGAAPRAALLGALVLASLWTLGRTHPFQLAYFNTVSGGLAGVMAGGHRDAGDYWGASYRRGSRWLNENAPPGAVLAVPWAEHLVRLSQGSAFGPRTDITLLPLVEPLAYDEVQGFDVYAEALQRGPVYVMFVTRGRSEGAVTRHAAEHGEQVYPDGAWDGVRLLNIYRVESAP